MQMKWYFHIDMSAYNDHSDKQSSFPTDKLSNLLISIFIVVLVRNDRTEYSV